MWKNVLDYNIIIVVAWTSYSLWFGEVSVWGNIFITVALLTVGLTAALDILKRRYDV